MLHVYSHTPPGPITEGNYAGITVMTGVVLNTFAQAKLSHNFFHQNACCLCKQFHLTCSQACDILLSCPSCCGVAPAPLVEDTNPRGLTAKSIWHTDVTHVPQFGHLKFVHVSMDNHSRFLVAAAHTEEKTCDFIWHWLTCFATPGLPDTIKMDNGDLPTPCSEFVTPWSNGVCLTN